MYLYTFNAFTTPCELHIDAQNQSIADEIAQNIIHKTKELEFRFSYFREDSELYLLNHRTYNTHNISDELAQFIQISLFYTTMTQGAFDIALAGTLKEISKAPTWGDYQLRKQELAPYASSHHLELDGNTLTFSNSVTKIDLGGLVKEYAVDQAVLYLQSMGVTSALVNFGGDLAAFGECHNLPWRVGIQNPDASHENLREIELHNASLCTSGHSKRFSEIEAQKVSHIIRSNAVEEKYTQVSIMAPTTIDAGIWSTALLVNPQLALPSHVQLVHAL
ncbi:MAG: FAD:protein FMN transferase [Sulfuricurvum sp.]|nr:FAD:protein FMN transferase [Sulfuricurvum sp.]MDD4949004.1 FAD:protein FMN transferase [Sulfuricurvum sp.]